MIEKLRDSFFEDKNGDIYGRKPSNEEIIAKVNEIIEFLNKPKNILREIENETRRISIKPGVSGTPLQK